MSSIDIKKRILIIIIPIICLLIGFLIGIFYYNNIILTKNETNVVEYVSENDNTMNDAIKEGIGETIDNELSIDDLYNKFPMSLSNIKVGDILFFGSYEQDNDKSNGKENIEWVVLYKSNKNSMMLISKDILDCMPYSFDSEESLWQDSDVRKFLNNDFYNEAFDDFNKYFIMENEMSNNKNINYKTEAGDETYDKVFLLSESQANRYFKKTDKNLHNKNRSAKATAYAKNKGIDVTNNVEDWYNGNSAYWLRTPGIDNSRAIIVESTGNLFNYGELVTSVEVGVRPCIWIKY